MQEDHNDKEEDKRNHKIKTDYGSGDYYKHFIKDNFKNKSIYKMQFNRTMKRQLSASIFAGKIDAFLN